MLRDLEAVTAPPHLQRRVPMSLSISIYIVEPEKDDLHWVGNPSNLLHDLLYASTGDTLRSHLSEDDLEALHPTEWPDPAQALHRAKDPRTLKRAIQRIGAVLQEFEHEFPRAHMIVIEDPARPRRMDGSASWRDEAGRRWNMDGFHHSVEHRDDLHVRVANDQTESSWIPARPIVEAGGKTFKIQSMSWHEICQPDIDRALQVCDKAIHMKARVLWAIS
jgi:hypothetical protein